MSYLRKTDIYGEAILTMLAIINIVNPNINIANPIIKKKILCSDHNTAILSQH